MLVSKCLTFLVPLFIVKALESGSLTCAELLLKYGADVSVQDNNGISVMHVAALADNTALMKLLWKNNADLNVKDKVLFFLVRRNRPFAKKIFHDKL